MKSSGIAALFILPACAGALRLDSVQEAVPDEDRMGCHGSCGAGYSVQLDPSQPAYQMCCVADWNRPDASASGANGGCSYIASTTSGDFVGLNPTYASQIQLNMAITCCGTAFGSDPSGGPCSGISFGPDPTPNPTNTTTQAPTTQAPTTNTTTNTTTTTAGNSISAAGDPHMTSVTGAKFDILRSGNHTLLNIPQHSLQDDALVFVRAFVKHEGATCMDMYIESLHIAGKWAEERQRGGLNFFASQSDGVSEGWLPLGKIEFKVVYGTTVSGVRYLNLFARHLGKLGIPVGGILGLDGHESATTPEANCQRRVTFFSLPGKDISSSSPAEESGGLASWASID